MENPIWVPVNNYEGLYEINQLGQVRSLHKRNQHLILLERIDRAGYKTVKLSKKGKDSTTYVHRLLGLAFIENPLNKPYINHIDGNKLNNDLSNLEWCTNDENMRHAFQLKFSTFLNRIIVDRCNGRKYNNIFSAAKVLRISTKRCIAYLTGKIQNPTCLEFI